MEPKILILGLCIFTLQMQISRSQDTPKCADVKTNLDQVNALFGKIQNAKRNFEILSSSAVSAVGSLNGAILRYTTSMMASGCEDKDKKSQVSDLLKDINKYQDGVNVVVKNYTKTKEKVESQYHELCPDKTASPTKELVDAVRKLLTSINASSIEQDAALQKFKTDKVPEKTIEKTNELSRDIFSCVLEYDFGKIKRDITKFNESLTKNLDEVESQKVKLNGTLTGKVEKFEYATRKMKGFDGDHGKHDFAKCSLNKNVIERVKVAGENAYKSFSGIVKNLTDYVNDGLKMKDGELKTKIGKCNDIGCIIGVLGDAEVLKSTVDDDITNYKTNNVTSIAAAKMQEAPTQFDKEADAALDCYLKLISSGSLGSAGLYRQSLILLGLLIVSKFVLC